MSYDLVAELQWRGLLQDIMPGTQEHLQKEPTTAYVGFDPTADSLHIGNLVPITLLQHLQRAGHKPLALVGGATGMIGDPSGKSEERKLLSEEVLRHNQAGVQSQLERFLDFDSGPTAAEVVNNYDWFKDMPFLHFLREVGKHLTVNYMMAKDSVKSRLETGISYTEFTYQLVQAYDFYHLYQTKGCRLQMGGSDQWGNITSGTELIRRMAGGEAFALTAPLVTRADGKKFGKSEQGNIWLDAARTSPYQFYQYWLNVTDEDAGRFLRMFTFKAKDDIEALQAQHAQDPGARTLQHALAEEMTVRIHGREEYEQAVKASRILFGKKATEELATINEATLLSVLEGVPKVGISRGSYEAATDVSELLGGETTRGEIIASKGEARRLIKGGGVAINKEKLSDPGQAANFALLQGKYLLVEKGKRNKFLIKVE